MMLSAAHPNTIAPSSLRFAATFEVDQSAVTRLQQWYEENNFNPENTPKLTDPTHPFQNIYLAGIKKAILKFQPLLDAIPEDFKLQLTPMPPFHRPGSLPDKVGGSDYFLWIYNQLLPDAKNVELQPVKTETNATHRYWTPMGQPKRSESQVPTIELTNPQIWLDALKQFQQWLPVGILSIALKAQNLNQERMNKLNEFQQRQQDKLSLMIAGFANESAVYYPTLHLPDITKDLV